MAVLDTNVVNVAVPSIHATLHASGAALQLVIAGYVIAYAVLLVTGARCGDLVGHRRVFLAGLVTFTLASLGCGLAQSPTQLIALRVVQGTGAAAMIPQVLSLIQRSFTGRARTRAMSVYSAVLAFGVVAGQVAGGLIVSADLAGAEWRPVFLVNVPIGVGLVIAGLRVLPASRGEAGRRLDLPGVALLTPAVLALVVPLVLGQSYHWPAWGWASLGGSVALFVAFATAERRLERAGGSPIMPGRVIALAGVRSGVAALFVAMAAFGGLLFVLALYLQGALGESPLRAGLTLAPYAVAFGVVSLRWQRIAVRARRWLPAVGFGVTALGLALMGAVVSGGHMGGPWPYLALGLAGVGAGCAFSPVIASVLAGVPVADAADATGMVVTANQLALVVGVASFGTLYLNMAGAVHGAAGAVHGAAFGAGADTAPVHAAVTTFLALAAACVAAGVLMVWRAREPVNGHS